jgi:dTDP-4-dehydrorhamnose 3,5-epimerase
VRAEPSGITGCALLHLFRAGDARGTFLKLFERSTFAELGLDPEVVEVFCSTSHLGVVRGLHFQLPPHAHAKTVVPLAGAIHDVVVDLRVDAPTYGEHAAFELSADAGTALHVPVGCAHGFQALTQDAIVAYLVSTEHAPEHDTGIHWDSAGIRWPLPPAMVSERDAALPHLGEFDSPFRMPAPARG